VYEAGDSITVSNGDTFVIALDANPSTGYSWEADANADVEFVKSKQVQGSSNAVGAPGTQQLTFKAVKAGSSTLTLNYLRPFEQGVPPVRTEEFDKLLAEIDHWDKVKLSLTRCVPSTDRTFWHNGC